MKTASISEIKQELVNLPPKELLEICLRLARYKKENKELVAYLLFDAHNESGYVESIKTEMSENFEMLPRANMYLAKKALRKILLSIARYSKHIASKQAETELRLNFCSLLVSTDFPLHRSAAITKMYEQQIKKIKALIELLHEDLRYDYARQLEHLTKAG